jgi:nitrate/nitrite transporter NarK
MPDESEPGGWSLRPKADEPRPFVRRLAVFTLVVVALATFAGLGGTCFAIIPGRVSRAFAAADRLSAMKWRFMLGAMIGAIALLGLVGRAFFADRAEKRKARRGLGAGHSGRRWEIH